MPIRFARPIPSRMLSGLIGVAVVVFLSALSGSADAEPSPATPPRQSEDAEEEADAGAAGSIFDRIWGYATLYDNPDGLVLKKFAFRGRFQADFPLFESDQGSYKEPQVRRVRVGFKSHWLADLVLHVEADIDATCEIDENCQDDAYEGLTDAYLGWAPVAAFELKLGKMSAPFTLDGTTSSRSLLTLERNNVSNNLWFPVEYHAGINASGDIQNWSYLVGVYSSSTTEEFGNLDGGYFFLVTLMHDFSQRLNVTESLLTLNYVYNEPDPGNVSTRDLQHVLSLHFQFEHKAFGFRSDLTGGIGYGTQPDLIGLALMPYHNFNEKFQFVARYTYLKSFGENGVRLARYENRIESGRGDRYNEIFVGLNWFVYGHDFKFQTGFKYTVMDDRADDGGEYRGWGWTTGFRMSW